MMRPKIVELDDSWREQYEAYCSSCHGLFYYGWKYRNFLHELLECTSTYLGALDAHGRLCGVFPIMEKSGPAGQVLNSLPFFGSYGGALSERDDVNAALWAK